MKPFTTRRLGAADAAAYRTLRLESLIEHPTAFTTAHEDEVDKPIEFFATRMEQIECHGGFDDTGALASIACLTRTSHPKTGHIATIWSVYARPHMRGTGLARAMLSDMIESARPHGGSLRLFVTSSNLGAHRLYRSLGFEDYCLDKGALRHDGVTHDGILMRLDFQPA